jgi:hypothetical protein
MAHGAHQAMAKAWATFSCTHMGQNWPESMPAADLYLTADRALRANKNALVEWPRNPSPHFLRQLKTCTSDRAFRRSESTAPSASRLTGECAHPRVSAPPSSRFAVTDGNMHAQVASKWRRFWRLLTGVRRVKHDSGSDDSCDPEIFFPRMRSGDPEVGVDGDKSEVCRRPLFARVRDAMAGGLELGSSPPST